MHLELRYRFQWVSHGEQEPTISEPLSSMNGCMSSL
jgi:hypothetical protein